MEPPLLPRPICDYCETFIFKPIGTTTYDLVTCQKCERIYCCDGCVEYIHLSKNGCDYCLIKDK